MNLKIEDLEKNDGKKKNPAKHKANTDVMPSEESRSRSNLQAHETDIDEMSIESRNLI